MRDSIYGFEPVKAGETAGTGVHLITGWPPEWAIMKDFDDLARNHCCATSLLNALRLAENFASPAAAEHARFALIHRYLPNGPVFFMVRPANLYLQAAKLPYRVVPLKKEEICSALQKGHPVFLLLCGSLFRWHWVVAAGFCDDENGARHLLLEDNWHRTGYEQIPFSKLTGLYFRSACCLISR